MQTALYLTDCSVDSALWLRSWLMTPTGSLLHITVVHPYGLPAGKLLHKFISNPAREQAQARLTYWLTMIGDEAARRLTTHVLFASSGQAATLHLLLNQYDYLLPNDDILSADTAQYLLASSGQMMTTQLLNMREP